MNEIEELIAEWDNILEMLRAELLACSNEKRKRTLVKRIDVALDNKNRLAKEAVESN